MLRPDEDTKKHWQLQSAQLAIVTLEDSALQPDY
jgi:hypothetical protein